MLKKFRKKERTEIGINPTKFNFIQVKKRNGIFTITKREKLSKIKANDTTQKFDIHRSLVQYTYRYRRKPPPRNLCGCEIHLTK